MMVARIVGCDGWLASGFFFPFLFFFALQYVDLSGQWNGGGWVCSDLAMVWVVGRVVVGWVLPIWWWMLGFTGM